MYMPPRKSYLTPSCKRRLICDLDSALALSGHATFDLLSLVLVSFFFVFSEAFEDLALVLTFGVLLEFALAFITRSRSVLSS